MVMMRWIRDEWMLIVDGEQGDLFMERKTGRVHVGLEYSTEGESCIVF